MGQPQILTRGARISGTVACALVALISVGWIVRDLAKADGPSRLWWMWAGLPAGFSGQELWVTGLTDLMLFPVCAAVAFTALRSPAAAPAFVAAGILTVALRLPSLWILTSDWTRLWGSEDLRGQALWSAGAQIALALTLIGLALWGWRPPARLTSHGYPPPPQEAAAARPSNGAAATAFIFLGAAALVRASWEIYRLEEYGWDVYESRLTGGRNAVLTLLSTPSAWSAAALVLIALVAAVAALSHATFSRPLGMTAATAVLVWGVLDISAAVKTDAFDSITDAPLLTQLHLSSAVLYAAAGAIVLVALSQRGEHPPYGGPSHGSTYAYEPPAPYDPRPPYDPPPSPYGPPR
ncbi:hypothetical protein DSC45_16520 [Streptomyces sp. YIM 130001]|uniref:hypothetical protein n=1 Tax=Streptomyces sp. YIM 130001 TaxID=2259644 RepID=UPI000EE6F9AF|nr:hypothetical protein [Streptomyces sp. YIM 130001]RII15846.1 hypothetical protein DSC45_16520 [Streptomyces sp. YIM 130001]